MTTISECLAREVFDSRGNPTVEVDIACSDGSIGRAIVPSGASTGQFEAHELRDSESLRLGGKGVRVAVENVRSLIGPELRGMNVADQRAIDSRLIELDGTPNKGRLGANAILGVSMACTTAAASSQQTPRSDYINSLYQSHCERASLSVPEPALPLLMVNMISGGLHAGRNLDLQDFLLIPIGATSYAESFDWIVEVYHCLGRLLREQGYEGQLVGDEGGFGPRLPNHESAFEIICESISRIGLKPGSDLSIAIDAASSHFYEPEGYRLKTLKDRLLTRDELIDLYEKWCNEFPLISIEDGLAEDDWEGWTQLTERLGTRIELIGDDLFVTQRDRVQRGIQSGCGNSVLIKVNQVGTMTETLETLTAARAGGYRTVVSARSGETEDTIICDLVVGTRAGQLKVGSVARGERLVKYNELLRMSERMPSHAFTNGTEVLR